MKSETEQLLSAAAIDPSAFSTILGQHELNLDDMMEDLMRVASSVSGMYTDNSCFALNAQDLFAECMKKVVDVMKAGWLTRAKTRQEFFKIAKTAMNNHVRGIVQRHRFTFKRTGHAAPDRNDPMAHNAKPDISLDDPDAHLQVASAPDDSGAAFSHELLEDLKVFLTPLEKMVLDQLVDPNSSSYLHSYISTCRGRSKVDLLSVKISHQHMAEGLGIELETFTRAHHAIKEKYLSKIMSNKPEDVRYNSALATLEQIFELQVPRSTEHVVIARLFTIAARDQLEKVDDGVKKLLSNVGAKAPVVEGERLSCFGVLFQRNHRTCISCGLRESCQVEALNYGLGEITLSPKLLGSRNIRTPVLTDKPQSSTPMTKSTATPTPTDASGPFTPTERDETILQHLKENFRQAKFGTDIYYTHKEGKPHCIFYVGKEGEAFDLRFCKPGEDLKKLLVRKVRSFYLQAEATAEDAIKLINQHAGDSFKA